jgi:hypothetical protein
VNSVFRRLELVRCLLHFRLRDMVKQLYDRLYDEREETRPLLLPVEWRTQLTLDGGRT